jgi:hypothetical protein
MRPMSLLSVAGGAGSGARRWLLVAVLVVGCNAPPGKPERDPSPPSRPPSSAAAASSSADVPVACDVSSAAPAATPDGITGAWIGHYDAKKGTVTLPAKVKDKAFAGDDGKTSVGPGTVDLSVLPSGEVRGRMSGALGGAAVAGRVDGTMIRAVVRPDDPMANSAMTGIFVGEHKGDTIVCELHVAGPDGTTIRESSVELTRPKADGPRAPVDAMPGAAGASASLPSKSAPATPGKSTPAPR